MMAPSSRPRPRIRAYALLSVVLALVLASLIFVRKVDAQAPAASGKAPASAHGAGPTIKLRASVAPGASAPAPAAEAAADAGAPAPDNAGHAGSGDKEDDDGNPDSIATAVLGPDGGVPIHTTGEFRSPFANPTWGDPRKVRVGILVSRVDHFDIKEGTFEADFNLSFTSRRPMPKMDLKVANGKLDTKETLADTPTFRLYRMSGTFSAPVDLHDYPFDTQELRIEIEDEAAGIDQVKLEAYQPHSNLDVGFAVPGWDVSYIEARTLRHYYPDRFDNDDLYYSQYIFKLGITRFGTSAAFTVFVPAIVIVLISLMGQWLPREELEVRSNAGAPMLAAAVLFHFALTQSLPATAYLTRADKLMMAVYVCLTLNMLSSWLWFVFDEKHTDMVFKFGRSVVPVMTVIIMLVGTFV